MVIRRASEAPPAATPSQPEIPTVSQFTRQLREVLEVGFPEVLVQGEISGWNRAASGHTYFTLKDAGASLGCVLWRGRQLRHAIRDGMSVVAGGRITLYEPRGQYQLDCTTLFPLGQGALAMAFEAMKARLLAEGLFDPEWKKPLPEFPKTIGLVTSRDGAALRDILTTLRRRMPLVNVMLYPTLVQGGAAAAEIARGIRTLNAVGGIDVMIVGRGGGSAEDLWAFNEEAVARAIFESEIPVISAVGHETDFTIADFVADLRAPTPTAAAELAVRDKLELLEYVEGIAQQMGDQVSVLIRSHQRELQALLRSRGFSRPADLIRTHEQRLDELTGRANRGLRGHLRSQSEGLRLMQASLQALNPANVLRRGYAIVERDGVPQTGIAQLPAGTEVAITMADGTRSAVIGE
ncbi:MAG: exodeoxyribonuclease VII large subunit [Chlorobi bacterium]|nr:exodeoxyribonuclease VII large subunit [Chlorobiota bacterium]MBX7215432.1 exodeoxyribonuclease VII large subunit [Candidatus Kapabacteria bacterium]